jgi:2-C-methyl-D-erythritol 2,4-cyclodiphosphate synthase
MTQEYFPQVVVGIGQDSRRFLSAESSKPCLIGGLIFEEVPGFLADSDGDVIFHAIYNAIASVSHDPTLEGIAEELCLKDGITDSQVYVEKALESLGTRKIVHIALSIEGKRPDVRERKAELKKNVARVLGLLPSQVGLTSTSGGGLSDFGCGEGLQCFCVITVR